MHLTEFIFPTYRQYKGIPVWFMVISNREFVEIKQVGSRFVSHTVNAEQYPEMLFIQDMLFCRDDRWEVIDEQVFMQVEKQVDR